MLEKPRITPIDSNISFSVARSESMPVLPTIDRISPSDMLNFMLASIARSGRRGSTQWIGGEPGLVLTPWSAVGSFRRSGVTAGYTAASAAPKMEGREGASCDRCRAKLNRVLSETSYAVRGFPHLPT